jgi:hypothetical protein
MPIEMATTLRRLDFAAGQRHSLKNLFLPERRVLIRLFRREPLLDDLSLIRLKVLFIHKK